MGNALKVSDNILDVCYGMRVPYKDENQLQPVVSEFDMETGQRLLDITILNKPPKLINIMYQIHRGVNIYES